MAVKLTEPPTVFTVMGANDIELVVSMEVVVMVAKAVVVAVAVAVAVFV